MRRKLLPGDSQAFGSLDFFLCIGGQLTQEVLPTSSSDPTSTAVFYQYVDRDMTIKGTCASGDYAGFRTDIFST